MRSILLALVPLVSLWGCDRSDPKPQPEPTPGPIAEEDPAPKPEGEAKRKAKRKAAMPPEARRNSPPEDMKILAEGAATPTMQDLASTEGPWSRSNTPTIVSFYRGHW